MDRKTVPFFSTSTSLEVLVKKENEKFSLGDFSFSNLISLSKRKEQEAFYSVLKQRVHVEGYEWTEVDSLTSFNNDDGAIFLEAFGKLWPLFSNNNFYIPKLFLKNSFSFEKVTFYGGTFNPWHEGHSECLRKCDEENIVIVPDSSPWKESDSKRCYFEKYLEICSHFVNSSYSIFPGFFGLEVSNPTVDWISKVRSKDKSLLMGDDNFCSFHKWKDYESLLNELNKIYVLSRDHTIEEITSSKINLERLKSTIDIVILGEHSFMDLSSTNLRSN